MLQLDQTKVTLENATNQLMALQNKQFVENRVYDDDETLANVENVPTTDPGTTNQVSLVDIWINRLFLKTIIYCAKSSNYFI